MIEQFKKFSRLNTRFVNKFLFLYLSFFTITTKLFHEPWRDEYQILGFLNHFPTKNDIFKEATAELLSPIFYYLVKALAIDGSYFFYSWIIVLISLFFSYKVIMKESVPIYVKIILVLPHIWFHWIVITRVYSFLFIFILIFISLDSRSKFYARNRLITLSCMNLLSIFGIILSITLYISRKLQHSNNSTSLKSELIYLISLIFGTYPYIIRPLTDVYYLKSNRVTSFYEYFINFKTFILNQINLFIGLPQDHFHFLTRGTEYFPLSKYFVLGIFIVGIMVMLKFILTLKWYLGLLFILSNVFLINWYVVVFQGADRHWIYLLIFNVVVFSDIEKRSFSSFKLIRKFLAGTLLIILLIHTCIYSSIILRSEIIYPFSSVSDLRSNISQGDKIIFFPNWLAISFIGDSNLSGYFLQGGYWGAFKGSNIQDFTTTLPPSLCDSNSIFILTTQPIAQLLVSANLGILISESREAIEITEGKAQIVKLNNICENDRWNSMISLIA